MFSVIFEVLPNQGNRKDAYLRPSPRQSESRSWKRIDGFVDKRAFSRAGLRPGWVLFRIRNPWAR